MSETATRHVRWHGVLCAGAPRRWEATQRQTTQKVTYSAARHRSEKTRVNRSQGASVGAEASEGAAQRSSGSGGGEPRRWQGMSCDSSATVIGHGSLQLADEPSARSKREHKGQDHVLRNFVCWPGWASPCSLL